jgi:hypothetical protein
VEGRGADRRATGGGRCWTGRSPSCDKARLLDLIRNFIIFDAGQKKVPRPHQFSA